MSDRGRDYVDAHSPYVGTTFLIHYRLGDLENDTHHHRLFMGLPYLADKCRCSKKTVQRALNLFVEEGFLKELAPETAERAAEYEFLFPETAVDIRAKNSGGHLRKKRWTNVEPTPTYITKSNNVVSGAGRPLGSKSKDYPEDFEAWWKIYPKPVDKKKTLGCWNKTMSERGGTVETIMTATTLYANKLLERGTPKEYTLNSCTFLGPADPPRWREYLPESISPETLSQARSWDEYDRSLLGGPSLVPPFFPRPQNSEGYLLDGEGRAYYIDEHDFKRRYLDDE